MRDFLYRHGCDATDIRDLCVIAAFVSFLAVAAALCCGA